jgi:hypothetical protein
MFIKHHATVKYSEDVRFWLGVFFLQVCTLFIENHTYARFLHCGHFYLYVTAIGGLQSSCHKHVQLF